MKCDKHTMLLYAVTDRAWVGEQTLYQQVESALKGGATCVQLREKQLGDADFLQEAIQIHALCQQYGVPLFINDNVEVALQCHAEGIHVGQSDMAAAMPNRNAGPALLQKESSRSASGFVSCPLRNAAATFCAPTGYPPRNAGISRDSAPSGIPNSRPKGRRTVKELPSRELVSRMDSTKKGNSEGITVRRHSSMP